MVAWELGSGMEAQRGMEELKKDVENFGVMDMLIILTVMMPSWLYEYVKTYKTVHFKWCNLLWFHYTLISSLKILRKYGSNTHAWHNVNI